MYRIAGCACHPYWMIFLAVLISKQGQCFESEEHEFIGYQSILKACDGMDGSAPDPKSISILKKACSPEAMHVYGRNTALSGDYLRTPHNLMQERFSHQEKSRKDYDKSTLLYSSDNINLFTPIDKIRYGFLALNNVPHFHGSNVDRSCNFEKKKYAGCSTVEMWKYYHEKAMEIARRVYASDNTNTEDIEKALLFNAFSDHFLQDAFSSGHMGVARFAHRPIRVKMYHDEVSQMGLYVTNRRGTTWLTFGDGKLDCTSDHKFNPEAGDASTCPTQSMVEQAGVMSVKAVLETMVSGTSKINVSTESIAEVIPDTFSIYENESTYAPTYSVNEDAAFKGLDYREIGIDLAKGSFQQFPDSDYYDTTYKSIVTLSGNYYLTENFSMGLTYGFSNHFDFVKGFNVGYDTVKFYNSPISIAIVGAMLEIDPKDRPEKAEGDEDSDDDCGLRYIGFRFTPEWSQTFYGTISYARLRDERFFKGSTDGIFIAIGYHWGKIL